MARYIVAGGGSGGGGATVPTFTAPEKIQRGEQFSTTLTLNDKIQRSESVILKQITLNDSIQRGDALKLPTISITPTDKIQRGDGCTFGPIALTAVSRSGTPDSDDWGDAWTDATVGNTGTNHGNADPLSIDGTALTTKVAWAEINLTRFTGLTATGGSHTLTFRATNTGVGNITGMKVNMAGQAGRPFTESTITQSNQPAIPSAIVINIPTITSGTTNALQTATLSDSQMNQLLGKWVVIAINNANTLETATIHSREDATTTDRMTITFTAKV